MTAFVIVMTVLVCVLAATLIHHLVILRVPFIPTTPEVTKAMITMARLQGKETVIDLGAGDGRLLREAVRVYPGILAIGIECVPLIWLLGWLRTRFSGGRVRFLLQGALRADVRKADVLLLYVMPSLLEKLEEKFDAELRPGTAVISNTFRFPHREFVEKMQVGSTALYRYLW